MGKDTDISWCHATANLWWGCSEVHEGCDNCYARTFAKAKGKGDAWDGGRFAVKGVWGNLKKWDDEAGRSGEVWRVFCGSMMDIFEKPLPASDWGGKPLGVTTGDLRDRLFNEVVPATPNLLYLFLTKRPGNVPKYVPPSWLGRWPGNVMVGASVVNQATADALVPQLLRVPGRLFLSMEPLLGPADVSRWLHGPVEFNVLDAAAGRPSWHKRPGISWIIGGFESGPNARPGHPDWARRLRDDCLAAGVPWHWKQNGEWIADGQGIPYLADAIGGRGSHVSRALFPDGTHMLDLTGRGTNGDGAIVVRRVGKKNAGRMLDGVIWDQFPEVAHA